MTTRSILAALSIGLLLVTGSASAQQAKCLAGKTKCMSKKATGLLKCNALAETPGKSNDPNAAGCTDKVRAKFDGGLVPANGCFEKLENMNPNDCITVNDTGTAETAIDGCVTNLIGTIDAPPIDQTKCGAGKAKCVSKYLAGLLKCNQLAQTPGKPNGANTNGCVDKATAKYTGGLLPPKGCFAKLEAKNPNDCLVLNDSNSLKDAVESCVDDLLAVVIPTTTTTVPGSTTTTTGGATTTTTTTTLPSGGVVLKGALTATPGRFNYNLVLGVPGATSACNANFLGTHACTLPDLQSAEAAGDLVGLKDIAANIVTSFWAIDGSQPPLSQCQDDALGGSGLNWEYGTAHTLSRGNWVALNNGTGALGSVQTGQQCNFANKWVGCCL
jgi:hypothetical protein